MAWMKDRSRENNKQHLSQLIVSAGSIFLLVELQADFSSIELSASGIVFRHH